MGQDGKRGRVCTDLRWDGGRVEWVRTGSGAVCTDLRWDVGRVEWVRTGRGAECALTCVGMWVG